MQRVLLTATEEGGKGGVVWGGRPWGTAEAEEEGSPRRIPHWAAAKPCLSIPVLRLTEPSAHGGRVERSVLRAHREHRDPQDGCVTDTHIRGHVYRGRWACEGWA